MVDEEPFGLVSGSWEELEDGGSKIEGRKFPEVPIVTGELVGVFEIRAFACEKRSGEKAES